MSDIEPLAPVSGRLYHILCANYGDIPDEDASAPMYRTVDQSDYNPICRIPEGELVLYLSKSTKGMRWHLVLYKDYVGFIVGGRIGLEAQEEEG